MMLDLEASLMRRSIKTSYRPRKGVIIVGARWLNSGL